MGYKNFGRGVQYYNENIDTNIKKLIQNINDLREMFDVVSFDNLAIEQLKIKDTMSEKDWNRFYMGDDGCYTMYLDLVQNKYAKSSTSIKRFDLLPTINDMFTDIRNKNMR